MTVFVDNMRAPLGRLILCHMVADTDEELHAMAELIGVARRHHQKPGTPHSHYDISLTKRALAVKAGAVEITTRQVGLLVRRKRRDAAHECRDCGLLLAPHRSFWCVKCAVKRLSEY